MIKIPDKKVTIIGAGMGGSLLAIYLARRNFEVDIYESRDCLENLPVVSHKSINQSLCVRGIRALQEVHLWDEVKRYASRETGRVIHQKDNLLYQAYGERQGFSEWSINRNDLNRTLIAEMKKYPSIRVQYDERCVEVDFENRTIFLEHRETGERRQHAVCLLIGADGIHSTLRKEMERAGLTDARLDVLDWGYKNIYIPAPKDGPLPFRGDAFHLWSKKSAAVFGIPNRAGFFTATITLPLTGPGSFESLTTRESLVAFFRDLCPDLAPYIAAYAGDFLEQPTTPFTSLYTSKWYYRDFCLLIGDSAHAMTIFYGQGINAAFEDCRIFAECLDCYYPDMETVFQMFQERRRPHTDVLAGACLRRFVELRDKYESSFFVARSSVEIALEKHFPNSFHSLYTLVVHTTMSYGSAYQRYTKERRLARLLGMDVLVFFGMIREAVRTMWHALRSQNA
ncbi:hypothetical protein A2765_04460 [Candidatus Kaiserbacteria bacterium RIFCSPHIGHO2_01_FULL_56_24]|uniref:FAD-binding domain-containing protein n=1 Tax=Candidatus Kaiserbacteria bacterium RIFCSPHIGHO2_01_FULL_56_24 TaxID=1798487 RepID=A0A1F6DEJ2_9BACT|nr:MAG: hypothetical protein A2765_04460 [Candidatus Kaiserbacteria bacterium RIFCSPHIGHO2_01_FULL_56_24]